MHGMITDQISFLSPSPITLYWWPREKKNPIFSNILRVFKILFEEVKECVRKNLIATKELQKQEPDQSLDLINTRTTDMTSVRCKASLSAMSWCQLPVPALPRIHQSGRVGSGDRGGGGAMPDLSMMSFKWSVCEAGWQKTNLESPSTTTTSSTTTTTTTTTTTIITTRLPQSPR